MLESLGNLGLRIEGYVLRLGDFQGLKSLARDSDLRLLGLGPNPRNSQDPKSRGDAPN